MLAMLNIYGPAVAASEGKENQICRMVAALSFNGDTHRKVWTVPPLEQADSVLGIWAGNGGDVLKSTITPIVLRCMS